MSTSVERSLLRVNQESTYEAYVFKAEKSGKILIYQAPTFILNNSQFSCLRRCMICEACRPLATLPPRYGPPLPVPLNPIFGL